MAYAFLCGLELNAAKEELAHGKFMEWCEKTMPEIPQRSAARYMLFTTRLKDEFPAVGKLATKCQFELLESGTLPEKERETVLKAVHEAADGKTITEMYRDLGVIREAKHQTYHPPRRTLQEKAADNEKVGRMELEEWLQLSGRLIRSKHLPRLLPQEFTAAQAVHLLLGKRFDVLRKRKS